MFRIDRRLVKLTGAKSGRANAEEKHEVDTQGEHPDAATSVENMARMYMSAAEKEADERAQAIVNEARERAAEIIEEAENEAEDIRNNAYDEGFAEGEREGASKYDEKLKQQRSEDEVGVRSLLNEIARERERVNSELEEETAALAVEIVRKIFNPAEEELGNVFISLIKNALRQMSSDNKFTIHVAPREYERFFSSGAAEIELDSGVIIKATVLRDVALEDGDLIIDTEGVTVNAGLNSQLKYVSLAFERANQYEPE